MHIAEIYSKICRVLVDKSVCSIFSFAKLETFQKSLVPLEIPTVSKSAIQLFGLAELEGIPVPEPD
jgi:hypothetical protein